MLRASEAGSKILKQSIEMGMHDGPLLLYQLQFWILEELVKNTAIYDINENWCSDYDNDNLAGTNMDWKVLDTGVNKGWGIRYTTSTKPDNFRISFFNEEKDVQVCTEVSMVAIMALMCHISREDPSDIVNKCY
jgi:hypothetical protein